MGSEGLTDDVLSPSVALFEICSVCHVVYLGLCAQSFLVCMGGWVRVFWRFVRRNWLISFMWFALALSRVWSLPVISGVSQWVVPEFGIHVLVAVF